MSTLDNLKALEGQDWLIILNYAMHMGGLDRLVISRETLEAFQSDPTARPYMEIGSVSEGGFVFVPTFQKIKPPVSLDDKPTLN